MPPIEYDFEEKRLKKTIQEHIEPMPKRLKDKWGSRLALLDFHDSIEQGIMDNGENVIKYVYTKSLAMGCKLIPVISFEKSKWYLTEIKSIISTQNCGLALRLFLEDLDKPNINGEIDQVLEMFDLNINNIDLIIDLKQNYIYIKPNEKFNIHRKFLFKSFSYIDRTDIDDSWLINYIYIDTDAYKNGLRLNDKVIAIDGELVKNLDRLNFYKNLKIDQKLEFTVIREGKTIKINFALNKFLG